ADSAIVRFAAHGFRSLPDRLRAARTCGVSSLMLWTRRFNVQHLQRRVESHDKKKMENPEPRMRNEKPVNWADAHLPVPCSQFRSPVLRRFEWEARGAPIGHCRLGCTPCSVTIFDAAMSGPRLLEQVGLDETRRQQRLAFLQLTEQDVANLAEVREFAHRYV